MFTVDVKLVVYPAMYPCQCPWICFWIYMSIIRNYIASLFFWYVFSAHVFAQVELTGNHIITPGHRVVFNKLIDSLGSAFSPATGVFRAPYEGTYLFSVQLCTLTGNVWTFFHIIKHGRRLTTGYLGDPSWGQCGSATAVTYMAAGSEVYVEAGKNNYGHTITVRAGHKFTGVLLNRN